MTQRRRYLPSVLWHQADCEYPGDPAGRRARYLELMRESGHRVDGAATDQSRPSTTPADHASV